MISQLLGFNGELVASNLRPISSPLDTTSILADAEGTDQHDSTMPTIGHGIAKLYEWILCWYITC